MLRGEEKECSWPHWKHENVQWAMNESKVHRKSMQGAPDDKERVLAGSRQALSSDGKSKVHANSYAAGRGVAAWLLRHAHPLHTC